MSDARIAFEHVWMKFHRGEIHDSLRDLLPALARRALRRGPSPAELSQGDFWAINDLSFEVGPGQVLGIIGANGSGKSTTLRILTKILEPTRGHCSISGRVGALIEVSAGFHGDLTGRENVYLQGAIMGLRSRDIARKFDAIVEFAGIEPFIDTQVKRYSSGMNARLGFAIAAHMDPDVLIIDEVLAVGDYMFQERAFGRISELATSGIPVVVVSHQLDRIAQLCTHAILLQRGVATFRGSPEDCIAAYVQPTNDTTAADSGNGAHGAESVSLTFMRFACDSEVRSGENCALQLEGSVHAALGSNIDPIVIRVRSLTSGRVVFASGARQLDSELPAVGSFAATIELQANLAPGSYLIEVVAIDTLTHRELSHAPSAMLRVTDPGTFRGTTQLNARIRFEDRLQVRAS